jgi:dihydroorotate dehydrogenase (NAD+) catalytic subunit
MPSTADIDLQVDLGRGLRLRTPILMASGTFGYGFDAPQIDRSPLGGIITKGTTLRPRSGNPPTRIAETPSGMLNAIGLQNPGVDHVASVFAPRWTRFGMPVIVNVAGDSIEDYVAVARRLNGVSGVAGLELNISCPNVASGLQFGVDPELAARVAGAVRAVWGLHLMVKLTPNVTDIVAIAKAVEAAGADSLSAINTYVGMSFDVQRRRPLLENATGGLSGPAIKPLALRAVWEVSGAVRIPVVGIGGIFNASDALEFMLAGAAAIQLGTVNYVNPAAGTQIRNGIAAYLVERGYKYLRPLALRAVEVPTHV